MLFNSYEFLFVFLPIALAGYFVIGTIRAPRLALAWLLFASLFFYAWWNPRNLPIIVVSICFNYVAATYLIDRTSPAGRKIFLALGVAVNLALLGYFKYANFFAENLGALAGIDVHLRTIVLPIAISFFTFQQIVFLVEAYHGRAKDYDFLHYSLLVTFFPHLIAGPIVHYREMLVQFTRRRVARPRFSHLAIGGTIFVIGLFKKVVVADGMAPYANSVFDATKGGIAPTLLEAWTGALAYTFQLYFDFSGYSDMAIGLARMIGIRFPMNFDSPYAAVNIVDFWRRWHITLSQFLRDYLYIPLGGNRKGTGRRYANLMITMLLGGLWHGAGWTFVIWGGLHGAYLIVNHLWQSLRSRLGKPFDQPVPLGRSVARGLTFLCVVIAWVFFRAEGVAAARTMLSSMFLGNGLSLPRQLEPYVTLLPAFAAAPVRFDGVFANGLIDSSRSFAWLALLLLVVRYMPNTQQLLGRYRPVLESAEIETSWRRSRIRWRPSYVWSVIIATLAAMALVQMWIGGNAEFLYFQF
jgi:D-alanyl-lipoteichoic acid acyltransferase DltB (MBOAT superfamily)